VTLNVTHRRKRGEHGIGVIKPFKFEDYTPEMSCDGGIREVFSNMDPKFY
jgi:hypothetical protein